MLRPGSGPGLRLIMTGAALRTTPGRRRCHPGWFAPATNRVAGERLTGRPYRSRVDARLTPRRQVMWRSPQPRTIQVRQGRARCGAGRCGAHPMPGRGASAQSRMSSTGMSRHSARARAIRARHQPQPAYSAAPAAESSVTGAPTASTVRTSASPCTTTAGYNPVLVIPARGCVLRSTATQKCSLGGAAGVSPASHCRC